MKKLNTVLLVDDDRITNFINQRLIEKLNITQNVTALLNGKEAIDYIKTTNLEKKQLPDLILLDINMPVMDGFEFVNSFRALLYEKKVIIVMLTTSSNEKENYSNYSHALLFARTQSSNFTGARPVTSSTEPSILSSLPFAVISSSQAMKPA